MSFCLLSALPYVAEAGDQESVVVCRNRISWSHWALVIWLFPLVRGGIRSNTHLGEEWDRVDMKVSDTDNESTAHTWANMAKCVWVCGTAGHTFLQLPLSQAAAAAAGGNIYSSSSSTTSSTLKSEHQLKKILCSATCEQYDILRTRYLFLGME